MTSTMMPTLTSHRRAPRHLLAHVGPVALLATALTACGSSLTSPTNPSSDGAPAGLQRRIDSLLAAKGVPGAVVAVRTASGKTYTLTSGIADLASGARVQPDDQFRVGSVTKPMVATVVLQLVDEGRISLDAPIDSYVPGVVLGGNRITVRQLLNHTAGLGDYLASDEIAAATFTTPERVWTPSELLAIARTLPAVAAPGAGFNYSNTHYIALGALVEQVTGRSIGQELQTRIFDRLKMRHTTYGTTTALTSPFAEGYSDLEFGADIPTGTRLHPSRSGAAGAVVSTAGDLAIFGRVLAAGSLLKSATQLQRLTGVPASALALSGDGFPSTYGLGVLVGNGWIGHNGSVAGYDAEVFGRADGSVIAVTMNKDRDDGTSHEILALVRQAEFR